MTATPAALVLYALTAADAKAVTDAAGEGAATAGAVLPAVVIRAAKKGADLQVFHGSGSIAVSGVPEGDGEGSWQYAGLPHGTDDAVASCASQTLEKVRAELERLNATPATKTVRSHRWPSFRA